MNLLNTLTIKPRLMLSWGGIVGACGVLVITAIALMAPWIAANEPTAMIARPYLWPGENAGHWLGTDTLGRDIWSGIAWGARLSITLGFAAGLLTALVGLLVGAVAGYYGGWLDNQLMRVTELFKIMPSLIFTLVLGITATAWPNVARLARGEARRLRDLDFVLAARVMGMRRSHILFSHILPNVLMPVVAMLAMLVGHAILTEAALAFLGMGDPNVISWGSMIGQGRDVLRSA